MKLEKPNRINPITQNPADISSEQEPSGQQGSRSVTKWSLSQILQNAMAFIKPKQEDVSKPILSRTAKGTQPEYLEDKMEAVVIENMKKRARIKPEGDQSLEKHISLGAGFYGETYEAIQEDTDSPASETPSKLQRQAVLKKIRNPDSDDQSPEWVKSIKKEIRLQKLLQDAPKIYGDLISPDSQEYTIAMENGGYSIRSLFQLNREGEQYTITTPEVWQPMSEPLVRDAGRQAMEQVEQLHVHGVCHRDLKPDNILINNQGKVRLIDFGLAEQSEAATQDRDADVFVPYQGTVGFMSPQMMAFTSESQKSDIFAMGITLLEMLTGKKSMEHFWTDNRKAIKSQEEGEYQEYSYVISQQAIKEETSLSASAKDLICKMVNTDPTRRPTAKEVLEHPFFKGQDNSDNSMVTLISAHREVFNQLVRSEDELEKINKTNSSDKDTQQKKEHLTGDILLLEEEVKLLQAKIRIMEGQDVLRREEEGISKIDKMLNTMDLMTPRGEPKAFYQAKDTMRQELLTRLYGLEKMNKDIHVQQLEVKTMAERFAALKTRKKSI